jgi:hypothetical protein
MPEMPGHKPSAVAAWLSTFTGQSIAFLLIASGWRARFAGEETSSSTERRRPSPLLAALRERLGERGAVADVRGAPLVTRMT